MPDGEHRDIWDRINMNRELIVENQKSVIALNGKIDYLKKQADDSNTKITCLDRKFGELKNELTNNKINDVKTKAGLQVGYWFVRIVLIAAVSGLMTLGIAYIQQFWK
jgi:hypothetical protein